MDFPNGQETLSLYDAGFLLTGVDEPPVPCQVEPGSVVKEKYGFKFPHIIEFEDDEQITRIPAALRVVREPCKPGLEMLAIPRYRKKVLTFDQRPEGHFEWKYNPVSLTLKQEKIFYDIIKAVQSGVLLPCVDHRLIPTSGNVEITPQTVNLLIDATISRKAYGNYAAGLPETVRAETQSKVGGADGKCDGSQSANHVVKRIDDDTITITFRGNESYIKGKGSQLLLLLLKNPGKEFSVQALIAFEHPGALSETPEDYESESPEYHKPDGKVKKISKRKQMQLTQEILASRIQEAITVEDREDAQEEYEKFEMKILTKFGATLKGGKVIMPKRTADPAMSNVKEAYKKLVYRTIDKVEDRSLRNYLNKNILIGYNSYYIKDHEVDWIILE
jgi:hypothetical protein